jgi:hypothetical protein
MTIIYVSAALVVLVVAIAALLRRRSARSSRGVTGSELGRARLHHQRDMGAKRWSEGGGS